MYSLDNSQVILKEPFTQIIFGNSFDILKNFPSNSIDAIVTDPPYGVKEYTPEELARRTQGGTGIWRLPPSFDGHTRSPLPRFTALTKKEREEIYSYFFDFGKLALEILKPGAHMFLACNSFLSQIVFSSLIESGLEFRTEIIRLVQTLRGGDRPKNAEEEFKDVCSLPRGGYEPWGLFRKTISEKMTVAECLRTYGTGGIRRQKNGLPFVDVISSIKAPKNERGISNHPSLKPQSFMQKIVYSSLPLGKGVVLDPFMGSGSTISAAIRCGYESIGIERDSDFFRMAEQGIIRLSQIPIQEKNQIEMEFNEEDL